MSDSLELRRQGAVLRLRALQTRDAEERRKLIQTSEQYEEQAKGLEMAMAGNKPRIKVDAAE